MANRIPLGKTLDMFSGSSQTLTCLREFLADAERRGDLSQIMTVINLIYAAADAGFDVAPPSRVYNSPHPVH